MRFTVFLLAAALCSLSTSHVRASIEFNFSNASPITINDNAVAGPYPSSINVSGIPTLGQILNIQVLINGFSHDAPDDVGAVVVAPSGNATLLFAGAGSAIPAVNLDWIFDDNAATPLPTAGALSSGTFRPGLVDFVENFPAPGPGTNWNTNFNSWLNEDPNGTWNLYVVDSAFNFAGSISGGWGLRFQVVPEPGSLGVCLLSLGMLALRRRRR
jgi:hypothetical protein